MRYFAALRKWRPRPKTLPWRLIGAVWLRFGGTAVYANKYAVSDAGLYVYMTPCELVRYRNARIGRPERVLIQDEMLGIVLAFVKGKPVPPERMIIEREWGRHAG